MKKSVILLLVLALVLAYTVVVPASAVDYVTIEGEGVPTLYVPKDGAPLVSASGEELDVVDQNDIVLTPPEEFDQLEKDTFNKLLNDTLLPMLFQDKEHEDENIEIDPDSVSLHFDFFLQGDGSSVLDTDDGSALNLRFDLESDVDLENLMIAQYVNGEWVILDPEFYELDGNILDILLENEGMIAFFAYRKVELPDDSGSKTTTVEEIPDDFRPSVTFRSVPQTVESEPGYYYVLETIFAQIDMPTVKIPSDEIKLRPATTLEGKDRAAYDQLANAEQLSDVCANLPDVLKEGYPGVSEDDLAVRDIFMLELGPTADEALSRNDEFCLLLPFRYSIKEGDTFIVLQNMDGKWVALDADCVVVEDGMVYVKVHRSGLLAFVVEG